MLNDDGEEYGGQIDKQQELGNLESTIEALEAEARTIIGQDALVATRRSYLFSEQPVVQIVQLDDPSAFFRSYFLRDLVHFILSHTDDLIVQSERVPGFHHARRRGEFDFKPFWNRSVGDEIPRQVLPLEKSCVNHLIPLKIRENYNFLDFERLNSSHQ